MSRPRSCPARECGIGAVPHCAGYAFSDAIRPTSAILAALGRALLAQVSAMMAPFGFGLAALGLRRR